MVLIDSQLGPFLFFMMIGFGLIGGWLIENDIQKVVYSENEKKYLNRQMHRRFPLDHLPLVIAMTEKREFSELPLVPPRDDEQCGSITIFSSAASKEVFARVEILVRQSAHILGYKVILPFMHRKVVFATSWLRDDKMLNKTDNTCS
jgi:hypothetical protein